MSNITLYELRQFFEDLYGFEYEEGTVNKVDDLISCELHLEYNNLLEELAIIKIKSERQGYYDEMVNELQSHLNDESMESIKNLIHLLLETTCDIYKVKLKAERIKNE